MDIEEFREKLFYGTAVGSIGAFWFIAISLISQEKVVTGLVAGACGYTFLILLCLAIYNFLKT